MAGLRCTRCDRTYADTEPRWRCDCSAPLKLFDTPAFSASAIVTDEHSLWRYAHALPLSPQSRISLGEGWTPLVAHTIAGRRVSLKLDHLCPSGSYKDRGAAVMLSKVHELGVSHVVEDSSGNAGAAVAAYAAAANVRADIYVPAANSPGKLAQIRAYGAHLVPVEGDRRETTRAVSRAASEIYYASHVENPYFLQGTKTFAFEVAEQLGFRAPDTVILPAGNGTLLLGSFMGFSELHEAGLIDQIPRHVAVQSAACAPLAVAFEAAASGAGGGSVVGGSVDGGSVVGGTGPAVDSAAGETVAEGIAIASPALLLEMVHAVRSTGGTVITVSEDEIVAALRMAVRGGLFIEPTAAAALAGTERYLSFAQDDEQVVTVVTGHGLKAPEKTAHLVGGTT